MEGVRRQEGASTLQEINNGTDGHLQKPERLSAGSLHAESTDDGDHIFYERSFPDSRQVQVAASAPSHLECMRKDRISSSRSSRSFPRYTAIFPTLARTTLITAQVETSHEGRWGPARTRGSASGDVGKPDEVGDGLRVTVECRGGPSTPSLDERVRCVESQVIDGEAFESCRRAVRLQSRAKT